jgi:hypothetical protein
MEAASIIDAILMWATAEPTIQAVALVGSHARGAARADSDIDFVLLATHPNAFRDNSAWLNAVNWSSIGTRPIRWEDEDYGVLWSRRMWLEEDGGEIEFGFAPRPWAKIDPIDSGTRQVISAGCRILYDPNKILIRLCNAVNEAN